MYTSSILILLASAGLIDGRSVFEARHADKRHLHHLTHKRSSHGVEDIVQARELANLVQGRAAGDASATTLAASAIQTGSFVDGTQEIGANVAQQAPSLTSQNNFINVCAGKVLTNGLQITTGSCNGITMGDIPAKNLMVSSIITFPLHGSATIESDTTFTITVQMSNLVAGSFTNADATYYAAPQALSGGMVVGHTHVTVQDLGATLNPTVPLDPTQFAFFKGINDVGNGQGLLSAVVTGGLPAGNYRVCTLASSSNHQPVIMPVAQRGTVDDCTKFTVIGNGKVGNVAANDGSKGIAAAAAAASAIAVGAGKPDPARTATAAASASASAVSGASKSTSETAATTKAGKDTKTASISSSEASTTTKGGKGGAKAETSTSISLSEASTTSKGGKGGAKAETSASKNTNKGKGNVASTSAFSFANTTFAAAATTKAASTSSISIASAAAVATSAKSGNTGKGGKGRKVTKVFVKKIVVIETFFEFSLALGGLCPSISKKNNQFAILEELFADLNSAASAACGKQYTACVSFSGSGFSIEECITQKKSCGSAASTAKAASTAAQVTGTVTVAASASVTGSVVSEATFTTTVDASSSIAASQTVAAAAPAVTKAAAVDVLTPSESVCTIVTSTVFVDEPLVTALPEAVVASTCAAVVTSTVFVDSPASTAVASSADVAAPSGTASAASTIPTADSKALGGIAAPAISNSGDATRPFLVNGNTFVNKSAAVQRSCDIQFNSCANAVNGGKATGFTLADCQNQEDDCINAGS